MGKSDRRYVPLLLRAEKIAGAAQLKIAHGQIEAAAESAVPHKAASRSLASESTSPAPGSRNTAWPCRDERPTRPRS